MAGMAGFVTRRVEAVKAVAFYYGKGQGTSYPSGTLYGYPRFDSLTDPWPRTQFNGKTESYDPTASAGNVADNSTAIICLGRIADAFPLPRLQVVELDSDGNWNPIEDHPALDLLAEPNPIDDFSRLSVAWAMSRLVEGNSYFVLTRTRGGDIAQIDVANPCLMRPETDNPTVPVQRYVYRVGEKEIVYDPRDILHWRDGRDPNNPVMGLGRLKRLILEVASDNEGSRYTADILHRMGVVGGIIHSEDDQVTITKEIAEKIKAYFMAAVTGSNRGGVLVPTFKSKYQEFGRSPQEMALGDIRQIPQARIAAVLGVPLQVAQLPSADVSGSYANYAEARESFWQDTIEPLQTAFCAGLTRYLLPQFGDSIRGPRRRRFRYNYDEVRAFQPDMDKVSKRKTAEWLADGITLNEYREGVGERALDGEEEALGSLYYSQHSGAMKPQPAASTNPNQPESAGDLAATADNAVGRTMPFGGKSVPVAAGLNGKYLPESGAAKAVTVTDAEGTEYVSSDRDISAIATEAFGDLDDFWTARRKRWEGEAETDESETGDGEG